MSPARATRGDERALGMTSALAGFIIWGLSPLFFAQFSSDALLILAHRVTWSLPCLAIIVWVIGAWPRVKAALADPKALGILSVTTLLIAANWGLYIWAVTNGRILETSLGYYLNPLVNVALGVILLKERLSRMQGRALALATAGVLLQIWAIGALPLISIALPLLFGFYGYLRKIIAVDAAPGLFIEIALVFPIALGALGVMGAFAAPASLEEGAPREAILLLLSGPVTVAPLLFFNIGAKRLFLSTIGILQFVAPTLSFAIGLSFGEEMNPLRLISFALIWLGLILYVRDARKRDAKGLNETALPMSDEA